MFQPRFTHLPIFLSFYKQQNEVIRILELKLFNADGRIVPDYAVVLMVLLSVTIILKLVFTPKLLLFKNT